MYRWLLARQANDDDGTKYLCSKAQLIDELEASLPGWVRRPAWYPQFVCLLKVGAAVGCTPQKTLIVSEPEAGLGHNKSDVSSAGL
jgi:hypothetical protein